MSGLEIFFLSCAIIGAVFFILRAVLFFYGVGTDMAHDGLDMGGAGHDAIDIHGDVHDSTSFDSSHGNTDVSFKFLSIQGISAFLTVFGLAGLAGIRTEWNIVMTFVVGIAAGAFTVFLVGLVFKGMQKLQSDGTTYIQDTIGSQGTVYLTIPAGGTGKVSLVVNGALKEYNAKASSETDSLPTGSPVKVVQVTSDNVLVVEKAV